MPQIEGFNVQNFRVLKNVTLGKLWDQQQETPLTPLVAVIGKNGSGKSTLFDAFGFLADCLSLGVEEACDTRGRGGFGRLVSSGSAGPISIQVYYRESPRERPITYEVDIALDDGGRPVVDLERLRQRRPKATTGRPLSILNLQRGVGHVWAGESLEGDVGARSEPVELTDPRRLGIATLGALKDHPRISKFRDFIQNWYLSYFTPDAVRGVLPLAGPQKQLSPHGENLGNVVQYMEREHPDKFQEVLERIAEKIPGVHKIRHNSRKMGDLLQFNDSEFQDPFYAQQMSDGTLKMFAYLLLLEDPDPPPFICIEEPENGLYHKLLEPLAHEFRTHAEQKHVQVFVTTHQPLFVDALEPEETWILEKGDDGFAKIHRASEDLIVTAMVEQGLALGDLWYSDYLDPRV